MAFSHSLLPTRGTFILRKFLWLLILPYSPSFRNSMDSTTRQGDSAAAQPENPFKLYHYDPTKVGAAIMLLLFLGTTALHCVQLFRARCWFVLPLAFGGICKNSNLLSLPIGGNTETKADQHIHAQSRSLVTRLVSSQVPKVPTGLWVPTLYRRFCSLSHRLCLLPLSTCNFIGSLSFYMPNHAL